MTISVLYITTLCILSRAIHLHRTAGWPISAPTFGTEPNKLSSGSDPAYVERYAVPAYSATSPAGPSEKNASSPSREMDTDRSHHELGMGKRGERHELCSHGYRHEMPAEKY